MSSLGSREDDSEEGASSEGGRRGGRPGVEMRRLGKGGGRGGRERPRMGRGSGACFEFIFNFKC